MKAKTRRINGMNIFQKTVKKSVKHLLTGLKIKRTGNISLPEASNLDEALVIVNNDETKLVKWFNHGRRAQAAIMANNGLLGTTDKETRKLLGQFADNLNTLMDPDLLAMSKDDAIALLSKKKTFEPVIKFFNEIEKGTQIETFDFENMNLNEPRWFEAKEGEVVVEDDEDEDEAGE